MAAKHWVDDDAGYEAWLSHRRGFMANLNSLPRSGHSRSSYFRIHRATHKLPSMAGPDSVNPRTGRSYSKVTAETIDELVDWAGSKLPALNVGEENYCRICRPGDDSAPTGDRREYVRRAARLLARGRVPKPAGILKPKAAKGSVTLFVRDPKVRAWVLQRAQGRCELCGKPAPFLDERGGPFLESHHLVMLSEAGPDTPDNTTALCPNCHRSLHSGVERTKLRKRLVRLLAAHL